MSSSYAIDSAWSHLENDDKIEKFIPLAFAIPAAVGALGAYRGAGGRFTDDQGNFDLNFGGNAKMVDPLTGGLIAEKELGSSFKDRALGGLVGATQFVNPFSYVRGAGALARGIGVAGAKRLARGAGSRLAARGANADAARRRAAAVEAAGDVAPVSAFKPVTVSPAVPQRYKTFTHPTTGQTRTTLVPAQPAQVITPRMQHQAKLRSSTQQARNLTAPGLQTRAAQNLQRFGQSPTRYTPANRMGAGMATLGLGVQQAAPALGVVGAYLAQEAADNMTVDPNTSGFGGYGGASSGFGSGQYGMGAQGTGAGGFGMDTGIGGVGNRSSNLTDRQDIWSGKENTQQFGGQIATGENMKIGERMLKQAEDMMYKAVCPKCGKKDCVAKMGCTGKEDKGKKPAHGMVIVIGSKAGPGPSKNGKREKLDSEKDKKDE